MHNGERATFQEVNIPTVPSNQESMNGEANILVVFINTFRGYFELIIHSEYILVAAILRVLWLTEVFYKVWGRYDFPQTPRVSKDACSGKFDQLSWISKKMLTGLSPTRSYQDTKFQLQ